MTKDHRLDLGRYITNPFNNRGRIGKRLDFGDLFKSKASVGGYPFNADRFKREDILKHAMSKKLTQNPDLNFVGNSPFFDENQEVTSDYELFQGVGRFNRPVDYDFIEGRAKTFQRPQAQPDFNPLWAEAYRVSPTLNPGKTAKNPMPRMSNPDPNGYIMARAEAEAEGEFEGDLSVSELLSRQGKVIKDQKAALEKKEGEEVVDKEKNSPDKIEGTA